MAIFVYTFLNCYVGGGGPHFPQSMIPMHFRFLPSPSYELVVFILISFHILYPCLLLSPLNSALHSSAVLHNEWLVALSLCVFYLPKVLWSCTGRQTTSYMVIVTYSPSWLMHFLQFNSSLHECTQSASAIRYSTTRAVPLLQCWVQ